MEPRLTSLAAVIESEPSPEDTEVTETISVRGRLVSFSCCSFCLKSNPGTHPPQENDSPWLLSACPPRDK